MTYEQAIKTQTLSPILLTLYHQYVGIHDLV